MTLRKGKACKFCGGRDANAKGLCAACFVSSAPVVTAVLCPGFGSMVGKCTVLVTGNLHFCDACADAEERKARGEPPAPKGMPIDIVIGGDTITLLDFVSDTAVRIAEARISSGRECSPEDALNYAAELWIRIAALQGAD